MTIETRQQESGPVSTRVLGYYASLATSLFALITFAIAIMTPPLSGPLCQAACVGYPYLDVISRFPRDYFWMFPAIALLLTYQFLLVCLHELASKSRRVYSLAALCFGSFASATLIITYFTQLSVIQPSLLKGEQDGISILSQYNPHGLFIALEELGFLLMAISFLFSAFIFSGTRGAARALKWLFLGGSVIGLAAFVFFLLKFGNQREYFFEIVIISVDWIVLILAGIPLSKTIWRTGE